MQKGGAYSLGPSLVHHEFSLYLTLIVLQGMYRSLRWTSEKFQRNFSKKYTHLNDSEKLWRFRQWMCSQGAREETSFPPMLYGIIHWLANSPRWPKRKKQFPSSLQSCQKIPLSNANLFFVENIAWTIVTERLIVTRWLNSRPRSPSRVLIYFAGRLFVCSSFLDTPRKIVEGVRVRIVLKCKFFSDF